MITTQPEHYQAWLAKHTGNGRLPHLSSGCCIFVPVRPGADDTIIVRVYWRDTPNSPPQGAIGGEKALPLGEVPPGWGGGWYMLQDWLAVPVVDRLALLASVRRRKPSALAWASEWRGTNAEYGEPIIYRGVDIGEDGGTCVTVWTEAPDLGGQIVIRVVQDGDEPVSEERLVQAEAWVRNTLRRKRVEARKGGAA